MISYIDTLYVEKITCKDSQVYLRFNTKQFSWWKASGGNLLELNDHELIWKLENEYLAKKQEDFKNDKDA